MVSLVTEDMPLQQDVKQKKGGTQEAGRRGPDADCGTEQALPRPRGTTPRDQRKEKETLQEGKTPKEMHI